MVYHSVGPKVINILYVEAFSIKYQVGYKFFIADQSVQSQTMKSATTNNEETSSVNVLEIAKLCVVGLAFVLAISTLALFADAQRQNDEVNRLLGTTEICLLFVTSSSGGVRVDNLKTSCGISFASASVATACLLIVCITSFIKLIIAVKKLNCNYN